MRILMTHTLRIRPAKLWPLMGVLAMALAFGGCDREQVKVQEVQKVADAAPAPMAEPAAPATAPAMPANPHAGMNMGGSMGQPQVKWTLPEGWQEKPLSEMRVGSFNATGKDGQTADVAIIPLPSGGPEMELANLNMWRSELQLSPVQVADSQALTVGSGQGKLFDIVNDKTPGRILVAVLDRGGVSWYFKMKGADSVVQDQKPAFLQFLKSIAFESAPASEAAMSNPHDSMTSETVPTQASVNSGVTAPAGWKELPPSEFLLAKYEIDGTSGAKADVSVSSLPGTAGGVAANIIRWRGQLSLPALSEDELSKQVISLDMPGGSASVVDMTGTDKSGKAARMVGVILPQTDQTWFYKLMGDPQIVEQQKDAFTKFIQTAKFSNAP